MIKKYKYTSKTSLEPFMFPLLQKKCVKIQMTEIFRALFNGKKQKNKK